jgi:signal transduction histidine kinase
VTNLIDNAIKYTEAGGNIAVRLASASDVVRVAVEDTGMGIPDADRGRIFERFYRVDKARSRALGGTGLGLSIVKHLVQAMGGDIWVESQPEVGSCFRFTLPRPASGQSA